MISDPIPTTPTELWSKCMSLSERLFMILGAANISFEEAVKYSEMDCFRNRKGDAKLIWERLEKGLISYLEGRKENG